MSNLQRKTKAAYAIECWLRSKNYKVTNKTTADITSAFLKSKGLPYTKFNPRYRGLWTPVIMNAQSVQEHFNEFTNFVLKNYEPLTLTEDESKTE
jgi:hypothetical protein